MGPTKALTNRLKIKAKASPLKTDVPDAALLTLRGITSRLGRCSRLPGRCTPPAAADASHWRRCEQMNGKKKQTSKQVDECNAL
jgi:hypothetical protein